MSTGNYQAIQIKNEFLSFLGVGYDATTKAVPMDKALAQAWVEVQTKWNLASTTGPVFSILWRDFAQYRLALITDGPGSARAEHLLAEFKESVKSFGDIAKTLDGAAVLFPPWMAGLNYAVGDVIMPSAGGAYSCTVAGVSSTTTEPSWAAPYSATGTGPAGGFVAAGTWNGATLYVNTIAGVPYYLWWDGATTWTVSLVAGTAGAANWTLVNATPVGAYTPNGTALTLTVAAGSATLTDGGVTWAAISTPTAATVATASTEGS